MRYPSQDSHPAFVRDDPSLLQYVLRIPQRIRTGHGTQESPNASAHFSWQSSWFGEIQRFSANTPRETQYETHTLPDFIPALQPQTHTSPFATLPNTWPFIPLHSEADMTPRPILYRSNPTTQTHYTHPSNYSTNRIGSLLTDHDMIPRPIRDSNVLLESIHAKASQIAFAAAMPHTSLSGSFLLEAVTTSRISISQEFPQSPSGHTDTRKKMSLPSIEPSQLNQKNDDDKNDNNDDLSIETIEYEDAVWPKPDDPWSS